MVSGAPGSSASTIPTHGSSDLERTLHLTNDPDGSNPVGRPASIFCRSMFFLPVTLWKEISVKN